MVNSGICILMEYPGWMFSFIDKLPCFLLQSWFLFCWVHLLQCILQGEPAICSCGLVTMLAMQQ